MEPEKEKSDADLVEAVKSASKDGKIPCAAAMALARKLGVSPRRIGKAADAGEIKIVQCQLGCFE